MADKYRDHSLAEDQLFDTMRYRETLAKLRTGLNMVIIQAQRDIRNDMPTRFPQEWRALTKEESFKRENWLAPTYVWSLLSTLESLEKMTNVSPVPRPIPTKPTRRFGIRPKKKEVA